MNKIKIILPVFLIFNIVNNYSQLELSLQNVIDIAHKQSISAKKVENNYENNYWRFFSYKRSFLPSVTFNSTLPNLNVGISQVTLPDGTNQFIRTSQINYSAALTVNQPLPWTGGSIFVSSDLSRLDLIGNNNSTSYRTSPFYIGYRQPIFKFNQYKWQSKIEPLNFEEAEKSKIEQKEDVSIEAVNLFFDLVNSTSDYEITKLNYANNDTLYKISKGRYNLGKIAESELLQIELTLLNSERRLAQSELNVKISEQKLKAFLAIPQNQKITLIVDKEVPIFQVDVSLAVEMAKKHRSEIINYKKTLIQSQQELDRVKKGNNFNADLFISYGLAQTGPNLPNSYENPLDQESINVGISVPIFNWGLSKAKIKQQVANSELIENEVTQKINNFEREIFIRSTQFNLMNKQVEIAKKSVEIAKKRYEVSKQRYLLGKSDILTYNNALESHNQSISSYNQILLQYWVFYYEMRKLTHYDFENNKEIN